MTTKLTWSINRALVLFLYFGVVEANLTLLRGGTFITWNEKQDDLEIIRDGAMLFDHRIRAISKTIDGLDSYSDATVVDTTGKIISPGFIDTHKHTWQTAMRTTGPDTVLVPYLWNYGGYSPAALHYSPEDVYISELMGSLEGLNAGVTSTVDHAHMTWTREHANQGLQGVIDSGARVFWCYGVQGSPTSGDPYIVNFDVQADQLKHIEELAETRPLGGGLVELGIAFDGFTFPGPLGELVSNLASNRTLVPVTAHALGGPFGLDGVIQAVHNLGALNSPIPYIFSHAVTITTEEERLLRLLGQYVSITPESEMHYGHTHPQAYSIQDRAALGVDTHFTFSSDILTQMRMWLQEARLHFYKQEVESGQVPFKNPMSVKEAFLLGTRNGGLALHRPDLGVLKESAKADIAIFSTDSIKLIGWKDPIAAIILHSTVEDIESVYVDGGLVKKDGRLVQDWEGKGYKERLEQAAKRWQHTFETTNFATYEDGVRQLFGIGKQPAKEAPKSAEESTSSEAPSSHHDHSEL